MRDLSLINLPRELDKQHPKLHINILRKHWQTTPLWDLLGLFHNTDFARVKDY